MVPELTWRCERCNMTLPTLHEQDDASYSLLAQGWCCLPCTRATKQYTRILRPPKGLEMTTYHFLYSREQRHYFDIDAENEHAARKLAQRYLQGLDFESLDDQSDDKGELEEVEE